MADSRKATRAYRSLNGSGTGYGANIAAQNSNDKLTNGTLATPRMSDDTADHDSLETVSPENNNIVSQNVDQVQDDQYENSQPLVSSMRRRFAFLMEMLLVFSVYLPFALLAPFYTTKAMDMDLSHLQIGLLLAFFALISAIASVLIGEFLPHIGPKFTFVTGSFLVGGCSILMAPQEDLNPGMEFFWYSFVTFLVWAVGHAATLTSCTAMISYNFPGNEATLFGVMESFIGLAFLLGGTIGSGLHKLGGYSLPFYTFGVVLALLVVINMFVIPPYNALTRESTSVLQLIQVPSVWTTCLALTVTFALTGISSVGLAIYLTDAYQVKDENAGFFWVLSGVSKTVFSILIGTLTNKLVVYNIAAARLIMIVGQVVGCVMMLLLGTQLEDRTNALTVMCIGLALEGIVKSCVMVPALVDVTMTARWSNLPDNFSTQSVISGLFWGAFQCGTFLGPILGGVIIDAVGFSGACHVGAVIFLATAAIVIVYLTWEFRCGRGRRAPFKLLKISGSDDAKDGEPLTAIQ